MTYFLDASALVKRYVREPGTATVAAFVRRRRPLAASRLAAVEVPAALWRRCRERDVDAERVRTILARFGHDLGEMTLVEVRPGLVDDAQRLVGVHPLRAYDAVQLASALRLHREAGLPTTFVCADGPLATAAGAEGLRTLVLR